MAGLFPEINEDALFLSRSDTEELLGSFSAHAFYLDEQDWPTVEHYFQAFKFENTEYRDKVRSAETPEKARKLGSARFRKIRKDWKQTQVTVMTRGIYIKCKTHPKVAEALLATGDRKLIESSNYDYFWGCGRDRRGENNYGKALMNVRKKLLSEA